jgi:CheY-like chemotaxis protein
VQVQFWGTRGSLATPGPTTLRYGGNTSCVSLRTAAGTQLIFDCGTGARGLGIALQQAGGPIQAAILIGHTHWDHIQGFPFFAPVFVPGNRITIYAPTGGERSLADVLAGQMEYTYFPVRIEDLQAEIDFRDLVEDSFAIGEAQVRTQYLNHTALTLAYRVTAGGVSVVYATDHEPHAPSLWQGEAGTGGRHGLVHQGDRRHVEFLAEADLVIHDAQYTLEEYAGGKTGWGHSPVEYVVDLAAEARAKRLALFHHDPSHDDDRLDRIVAECQRRAEALGADLAVFGAAEGQVVELRERPARAAGDHEPAHPSLGGRPRILIAEDDADVRGVLVEILEDDDYELVMARDGREALALALGRTPDLVILDLNMPALDGREVCRGLRGDPRTRNVPVVILTASGSELDIAEGFEGGATDYITKPFAPAMVRTRVRSWLLRGGAEPGGSSRP